MAVFIFGRGNPNPYSDTFSENSWDKIIKACQTNKVPSTWLVGDYKEMTINGAPYAVVIIGKAHDTYSDGTGMAPLTFQLRECYETKYPMNSTDSNVGGWGSCKMRSTHLPAIMATMPNNVQLAIREVNKLTSAGNKSSTIKTTADKLVLLSEMEVYGVASYAFPGEGTRYAYYSNGASDIKKLGDKASGWWLRSPDRDSNSMFCSVSYLGGSNDYFANYTDYGMPFAFCF